MSRILVVDDEASIRESLEMILSYEDHEVLTAPSGDAGLRTLERETVDLVLLDIRMPGRDGLDVLEEIRRRWPDVLVIMVSGHATIEAAVDAAKKGAFHFIEKPLDRDRLLLTVRAGLEHVEVVREKDGLAAQIDRRSEILGESEPIRAILETIDRVAKTDARVLITGENGSGKEHVARRIHWKSKRRSGPFVDINCAAIPPELIESELFGHEKGAFTGAVKAKKGSFERADGGTLFLDEIGDMSLDAQAKVLRVLEEGRIQRVGGTEPVRVDARILAATNKDLAAEVREGRFREDLFYRLNVVPIHNPPLRERAEDIRVLGARFLVDACERNGIAPKRLREDALEALEAHPWPGNIRELRNLLERIAILGPEGEVGGGDVRRLVEDTQASPDDLFARCETFEEFKEQSERLFLEKKLSAHDWNVKRTAESLGMQRSNLYKKLQKYGLR